ncbi:MAG: DUF3850 domain-containing protein [Anaerocolumna sp.]
MAAGFKVTDVLNKNSKASGIDESPKARSRTKDISIFKIYPNKLNFYPQNEIEEKAGEILAVGLIEPLVVKYALCEYGEYGIISGERRWRGLNLLVEQGHKEFEIVTCQIRTPDSEQEEKLEIIMANSHRQKDVATMLQEEKELKETLEYMKINNMQIKGFDLQKGRLRDIIARILNTSKTKVALIENINNNLIPEFKEELKKDRLTFSAAAEIAGLEDEKQQEVLSKYQDSGEITYTEIKEIKEELKEQQEPPEGTNTEPENTEESTDIEEDKKPEGQQDTFNPCPDTMTTRRYSCANWDDCPEKGATVTYCKDFKDRDKPNTPTDREAEEKANFIKQTSQSQPIQEEKTEIVTPDEKPNEPRVHDIKLAGMYFGDVLSGIKPFELRKNDRDYKIGDTLHQMEYMDGNYTGRGLYQEITYVLEDYTGLTEGYCILGTKLI